MRNVHIVLTGTTQNQSPFMRKKQLTAHVGGHIVEFVQGADGSVLEFTPRFFPFYDTTVSDDSWAYQMYAE